MTKVEIGSGQIRIDVEGFDRVLALRTSLEALLIAVRRPRRRSANRARGTPWGTRPAGGSGQSQGTGQLNPVRHHSCSSRPPTMNGSCEKQAPV